MVAYNFNAQFADDVESGKKLRTIRKAGKRNTPSVGDQLQLYTGMRTKNCRFLALGSCEEVRPIRIRVCKGVKVVEFGTENFGWCLLHKGQAESLAKMDGFKSLDDFFNFFLTDTNEFVGHIIVWKFLHSGGVK